MPCHINPLKWLRQHLIVRVPVLILVALGMQNAGQKVCSISRGVKKFVALLRALLRPRRSQRDAAIFDLVVFVAACQNTARDRIYAELQCHTRVFVEACCTHYRYKAHMAIRNAVRACSEVQACCTYPTVEETSSARARQWSRTHLYTPVPWQPSAVS